MGVPRRRGKKETKKRIPQPLQPPPRRVHFFYVHFPVPFSFFGDEKNYLMGVRVWCGTIFFFVVTFDYPCGLT